MISKHLCPCCSQPLLPHISFKRKYWFCSQCYQEMPDLESLEQTKLASQHCISKNLIERKQLKETSRQSKRVYSCLETNKELQHVACSNRLTKIANRYRFQAYLDQEWRRMMWEQAPLSLILGNLDFFQADNDIQSYQANDECLQQVAKAIINAVQRPADLVPRYGGEEFIVILPNTKPEEAVRVAEDIRFSVKALEIVHSKYLTLCLGVASIIPTPEYSAAMLMSAAEQALDEAKAQGYDAEGDSSYGGAALTRSDHRVVLHETLLRQTKVVEQEKTLVLQPSQGSTPVPVSGERNSADTKTEQLMSYVAYYVSRGKSVISPLSSFLSFEGSVYQYCGYHKDFQDFWRQLQQRRDFRDLYLEGDFYCFGQFLGGSCTVGECARCQLPVPRSDGSLCKESNCTLCDDRFMLDKAFDRSKSQDYEQELGITRVVAIGATPTESENLEEWFSLNRFQVTFVSHPEEITPQSLPSRVDLVLIFAEVSEAQGKAWAQELTRHPQFQGVPIVALSANAGNGLPWMERTLGIEDYVLTPYGGDRLANHLRQVLKPQLRTDTAELYWFPR